MPSLQATHRKSGKLSDTVKIKVASQSLQWLSMEQAQHVRAPASKERQLMMKCLDHLRLYKLLPLWPCMQYERLCYVTVLKGLEFIT